MVGSAAFDLHHRGDHSAVHPGELEEVKPSPAEFSHIIHEKRVMSKDAAGVPTKLTKTVSGAAMLPL